MRTPKRQENPARKEGSNEKCDMILSDIVHLFEPAKRTLAMVVNSIITVSS